MSRRRSTWTLVVLTAAAAFACLAPLPSPAEAASEPQAPAEENAAERGRLTYRINCAVCHGVEARGDGPLAEFLKVAPTDLTAVAAANDEIFPAEEIARTIDGRDEAIGHGPRDMPVWGISLQDPGSDSDQEKSVERRIADLVAFIESIQE